MTIPVLLVLSVLGSAVLGISDEVNFVHFTVTIDRRYALQDYLCSGQLKSNMTIQLDAGVHRISPGLLCNIFNESNITIAGSSTDNTIIRCEGEERWFSFISVQNLTMKKLIFINCGQQLQSTQNTLIADCVFQNNSNGALSLISSAHTNIINCMFEDIRTSAASYGGGVVRLSGLIDNVDIINCTFQNNNATYGGAVMSDGSLLNVNIINCTFLNNRAILGGAVWLRGSTVIANITDCKFQDNNAYFDGGALWLNGSTDDVMSITHYKSQNTNTGEVVELLYLTGHICIMGCTFLNNSATYGRGGAVWLEESTGSVSITHCTFQSNSATVGGTLGLYKLTGNINIMRCIFLTNMATDGSGGAVWLDQSTVSVSITHCTFQSGSATGGSGGGVRLGGLIVNVSITNCTFENNSANDAGAVLLHESRGDVSIANSTFNNNNAIYGAVAVWIYGSMGNLTIKNCIFENNSAATGSGGAIFLDTSTITGTITHSIFQNNSAAIAGGAVGVRLSSVEVSITSCTFQNNLAAYGGTVCISYSSSLVNLANNIFQNSGAVYGGAVAYFSTGTGDYYSITNCTFQNNSAIYGGAILSYSNIMIIQLSKFVNNNALVGAAMFVSKAVSLILEDVVVNDNHCNDLNEYNMTRGGAIYFYGANVTINGSTDLGSRFSSNSPQGAIQGENGFLLLCGNITFTNNTGENGGAISLSNNIPLVFHDNCNLQFSRNIATRYGGAIYNEGVQSNLQIEIKESSQDWLAQQQCAIDTVGGGPFFIAFIGNHAQQGGHAVYATPIYECIGSNLANYFTITPLPDDLNDTQVLSFPIKVQLCDSTDPDYKITSQYEGRFATFPGRSVSINVTSVDYGNHVSPSAVYTQIDTGGVVSPNITLGPMQSVQWIGSKCTSMEYQIYGPEMATLRLLLSNYPGYPPTVIEVNLLPCEPGFTLMVDSGLMECGCSRFLTSHGVLCDTSDGTVIRQGTSWIGVYNNTLPALASTCPLDYCNIGIRKLSLARPRDLCNEGRSDLLCGHCHGNHSVIFGSSKCQVCSDMWLITLVMFAVLGALLVAALFFLNLTITQGTLYGLIFYANIIQVNTSIFFSQSILKPLHIIVSFVNLDLGLPLCFYDGMDDADKVGLQFVFPAYLLILTLTVTVVCHYCLQRSPTISSRSCLYRFPIIIGDRAVSVISTLIYLSYSKLLRTVVDVLTYSTIHLPSGDINVWFFDGNVEYLHGKHIALFVVAMVTCALFLLPYTLAITFIPIIESYSEHNRLFIYLHKKANQIKPMNDAHYAPYKGEWRWWLGARLWLLVVMYGLNPVYCSDQPSLLLSIQATMVILFMLVQAKVDPLGQTLQKPYKYMRSTYCSNFLFNCLDLFYLLNYTVLALSISYILDHGSDQNQITVSVGVLVGLYIVILMVTFLYHLIVAILKACNNYDRVREKINGCFRRKYELILSKEEEKFSDSSATSTETCSLREPMLEV